MIISTIYAINLNHHSEFIHPEFTAVYGHNLTTHTPKPHHLSAKPFGAFNPAAHFLTESFHLNQFLKYIHYHHPRLFPNQHYLHIWQIPV